MINNNNHHNTHNNNSNNNGNNGSNDSNKDYCRGAWAGGAVAKEVPSPQVMTLVSPRGSRSAGNVTVGFRV